MTKLEELHNQVIEHVKKGEFAQGIENFYSDNVTQQENSGVEVELNAKKLDIKYREAGTLRLVASRQA